MDYQKHYDLLIERSKTRKKPKVYTEKHHIVPRCLGGQDNKENLSILTPEEHYIAHQLLVKIYPDHTGLLWAAIQLTGHPNGKRNNNKIYGWLKRRYSKVAKQRTGKKNGSYNRLWFYDPATGKNGKFKKEEVPTGWIKGRAPVKFIDRYCDMCNTWIDKILPRRGKKIILCEDCRKEKRPKSLFLRKEEFLSIFNKTNNLHKTLKIMGYSGAVGEYFYQAKELLSKG